MKKIRNLRLKLDLSSSVQMFLVAGFGLFLSACDSQSGDTVDPNVGSGAVYQDAVEAHRLSQAAAEAAAEREAAKDVRAANAAAEALAQQERIREKELASQYDIEELRLKRAEIQDAQNKNLKAQEKENDLETERVRQAGETSRNNTNALAGFVGEVTKGSMGYLGAAKEAQAEVDAAEKYAEGQKEMVEAQNEGRLAVVERQELGQTQREQIKAVAASSEDQKDLIRTQIRDELAQLQADQRALSQIESDRDFINHILSQENPHLSEANIARLQTISNHAAVGKDDQGNLQLNRHSLETGRDNMNNILAEGKADLSNRQTQFENQYSHLIPNLYPGQTASSLVGQRMASRAIPSSAQAFGGQGISSGSLAQGGNEVIPPPPADEAERERQRRLIDRLLGDEDREGWESIIDDFDHAGTEADGSPEVATNYLCEGNPDSGYDRFDEDKIAVVNMCSELDDALAISLRGIAAIDKCSAALNEMNDSDSVTPDQCRDAGGIGALGEASTVGQMKASLKENREARLEDFNEIELTLRNVQGRFKDSAVKTADLIKKHHEKLQDDQSIYAEYETIASIHELAVLENGGVEIAAADIFEHLPTAPTTLKNSPESELGSHSIIAHGVKVNGHGLPTDQYCDYRSGLPC